MESVFIHGVCVCVCMCSPVRALLYDDKAERNHVIIQHRLSRSVVHLANLQCYATVAPAIRQAGRPATHQPAVASHSVHAEHSHDIKRRKRELEETENTHTHKHMQYIHSHTNFIYTGWCAIQTKLKMSAWFWLRIHIEEIHLCALCAGYVWMLMWFMKWLSLLLARFHGAGEETVPLPLPLPPLMNAIRNG